MKKNRGELDEEDAELDTDWNDNCDWILGTFEPYHGERTGRRIGEQPMADVPRECEAHWTKPIRGER